jgi:hypothetical protein
MARVYGFDHLKKSINEHRPISAIAERLWTFIRLKQSCKIKEACQFDLTGFPKNLNY